MRLWKIRECDWPGLDHMFFPVVLWYLRECHIQPSNNNEFCLKDINDRGREIKVIVPTNVFYMDYKKLLVSKVKIPTMMKVCTDMKYN